ncbi:MAG: phosphoribosylanthranilate isomerase [Gammaproteobacteria bacterium]|jgi:phosphoribosylanthranilate isomerase|nr:phosphoribosylanthranilate isomerase [Gammaproteobacteria bacterium]
MRTRVKICGITARQDARDAVDLGADALGLVFYPPSPRCVTVEQARAIVDGLPPFVTVVGLFVNAERAQIATVLAGCRIDLLQFHGQECPDYCAGHGRPYLKAVRMREGVDLAAERSRYATAGALLLDTYQPGVPGGTGEAFDWTRVPAALAGEVVLAGGLTPDNVTAAVRQVRPYAVDVSGGVERAKGRKDRDMMAAFMRGVALGNG